MITPGLIVAGNWKMNGIRADLAQIEAVKAGIGSACTDSPAKSWRPWKTVKAGIGFSCTAGVWIFPPATLIHAAASLAAGSPLVVGAQDCHTADSGAFTGDLSAPILKDAGATAVIVGHSERRTGHGETSRTVRAKAAAALKHGLTAVVCLGETKGEREAGLAPAVCTRQLTESLPEGSTPANTVIAYEPVWAIGTGLQATTDDITAIHAVLRTELGKRQTAGGQRWHILYGGSVNAANAAGIFQSAEVDGVLVGGASLNASSFLAIISAATQATERRRP